MGLANYTFNGVTLNAVVGEPYGVIRGTNYVYDNEGNKVINANGSYAETQNVENLGSILPDYNMGIRNSFTYKGINLGFLIDVQKGGKYRSLTNIWGHYSGILESTAANNIREEGLVLDGVTGTVTYDDSVRVSAFGRNLAVWGLDNDNFDPEVASTGSGNIQGAEGGSLPSTRSIGFNVELKF